MKFSVKVSSLNLTKYAGFHKSGITVDLVTLTEEILNGKLHFFCVVSRQRVLIEYEQICTLVTFTCSKSTAETLEKCVKYVQS